MICPLPRFCHFRQMIGMSREDDRTDTRPSCKPLNRIQPSSESQSRAHQVYEERPAWISLPVPVLWKKNLTKSHMQLVKVQISRLQLSFWETRNGPPDYVSKSMLQTSNNDPKKTRFRDWKHKHIYRTEHPE